MPARLNTDETILIAETNCFGETAITYLSTPCGKHTFAALIRLSATTTLSH